MVPDFVRDKLLPAMKSERVGVCFLIRREVRQAIGYFEQAVQIDPADVNARVLLGSVLYDQGNAPEAMKQWEQALLFLNSRPSGLADPLFGKDISFYLFQYPFLDAVNAMVRGLIVFSALLTALLYLLRGGIVFLGKFLTIERVVKRHLGVLVALYLLSLSLSFFLDRYGTLLTEHGARACSM